MQAIILMGIQASGKTTFYVQRFLHSHVRISQDLLRTRHREKLFLQACLDTLQPFVVDKTNAWRRSAGSILNWRKRRTLKWWGTLSRMSSFCDAMPRVHQAVVPDIAILVRERNLKSRHTRKGSTEFIMWNCRKRILRFMKCHTKTLQMPISGYNHEERENAGKFWNKMLNRDTIEFLPCNVFRIRIK